MPRQRTCSCGSLHPIGTPCPRGARTGQRGSTRRERARRARLIAQARAGDGTLRCEECNRELAGGRDTHLDHDVPKRAGGSDADHNRAVLCGPCNLAKGGTA